MNCWAWEGKTHGRLPTGNGKTLAVLLKIYRRQSWERAPRNLPLKTNNKVLLNFAASRPVSPSPLELLLPRPVSVFAFPGAAPVMPWQNYGQTQSDVVVVVNDVVRLCLGRCRKSSAVCATPSRRGCHSCLPHMKMVFIKEKTTQQARQAGQAGRGREGNR